MTCGYGPVRRSTFTVSENLRAVVTQEHDRAQHGWFADPYASRCLSGRAVRPISAGADQPVLAAPAAPLIGGCGEVARANPPRLGYDLLAKLRELLRCPR